MTLIILLLALVGPAQAETPRVLPLRDVSVVYQASGAAANAIPSLAQPQAGPPGAIRLSWQAGGQKLRAEAEGRQQTVIADLPSHRATVLDDTLHAALVLPMRDTDVQALTMANARFTRRGRATVAGEPCTEWAVQAAHGNGTVCLTEDGVPLRGEGEVNGKQGAFTATRVDRGAVDPALFAPPPGYNRLEMPRFGR